MNNHDKDAFKVLMVGAGEIYNKVVTKPLLQVYFSSLDKYPIEVVSDAFTKHLTDVDHGTFFPKPADIIRIITAGEVSTEDKAELAWMEVINAISTVGSYGTLKLKDKQAMAAVKNLGSWVGLCQTKESDLQWKKKQFIENYMTFDNTPADMLPKSLPGIEDLHNQKQDSAKGLKNLIDGLEDFRGRNEK